MEEFEKNKKTEEKQEEIRYNTYNERGHRNVPAIIFSIVSIFVLCCVPFLTRYNMPICYIEQEDGKLMLATLVSMAIFYFLGFDMVGLCVATVNIALLVFNTYDMFLHSRNYLLGGFYWILALSVLVIISHFIYPLIIKGAEKRKKDE